VSEFATAPGTVGSETASIVEKWIWVACWGLLRFRVRGKRNELEKRKKNI
jgi:hypothetical protein